MNFIYKFNHEGVLVQVSPLNNLESFGVAASATHLYIVGGIEYDQNSLDNASIVGQILKVSLNNIKVKKPLVSKKKGEEQWLRTARENPIVTVHDKFLFVCGGSIDQSEAFIPIIEVYDLNEREICSIFVMRFNFRMDIEEHSRFHLYPLAKDLIVIVHSKENRNYQS